MNLFYELLLITGPTASGKTTLAATIAKELGGEIISADSRQVYRGMNIGTGKDYDDYIVNGTTIPYHLVDIVDPGYKYSVFEFQNDFIKVYNDLTKRGKFPVVCGGSGMYADSIVSGYSMYEVPPDDNLRSELESKSIEELKDILTTYKKVHNTTDFDTKKRIVRAIEIENFRGSNENSKKQFPEIRSLVVGILFSREERRKRITERLNKRLASGMVDEVKHLIDSEVDAETLIYYGLEYKYITLYLTGQLNYNDMVKKLEIAIHRFAKRQMTWFRGMERRGVKINWLDGNMTLEKKTAIILDLLSDKITDTIKK